MAYTPYYSGGWQSGEQGGTPITPAALNNMESGIGDALPKSGGTMTGNINMGQFGVASGSRSVSWITADGTTFSIRPYENVFQIVRQVSDNVSNVLGFNSDGTVLIANIGYWRNSLNVYSKAEVDALFGTNMYSIYGNIVQSASTGTTVGYGKAEAVIVGKTVTIAFMTKIVTSGTLNDVYDVGIQVANLRTINPSLPAFNVSNGGIIHYYKPDGTLNMNMEGYAGEMVINTTGNRWSFGRLYNTSGAVGAWSDSAFSTDMIVSGMLYGALS